MNRELFVLVLPPFPATALLPPLGRLEIDFDPRRIIFHDWELERSSFEVFVKQGQPVPVPPQHLDSISPAVDEEKEMAFERVSFKDGRGQREQAIEALSHVGRRRTEKQPDITGNA